MEEADTLIVTIRTGFPHGMAATRRILLIAKALQEGGATPAVIHANTSESCGSGRNTLPEGVFQGIPFRYTCGRTIRPDSFLSRRLCTISGFIRTCRLVAEAATSGRLKAVIFYERSIFSLLLLMLLCRLMEVTFALDLVEWPVAMESKRNLIGRTSLRLYRTVALRMADRVTTISNFLLEKVSVMGRKPESVMYLPILADPGEVKIRRRPVPGRIVISISAGYSRELRMLLDAFAEVRMAHPRVELHITGGFSTADLLRLKGGESSVDGNGKLTDGVRCRGYLPRADLLELFATSCAAVVALEDDLRSLSRMPTKIADYTFNGIPLVTGDIGDVSRLFTDGESAFMYKPGDASSLAASLLRVLDDMDQAEEIGIRGKLLALERFSYTAYSRSLPKFLMGPE